jgi:lysylphosphatidylglycerol synthetase-like protein (DUF2156 family)
MDDQRQKAFDYAQETTKQLLTLSTGIFALTFTFLKDILKSEDAQDAITLLHIGWALYIVSVAFGVAVLMMLAGNLERPKANGTPSIYAGSIKLVAGIQIFTFFAGLVFTFIFGARAT